MLDIYKKSVTLTYMKILAELPLKESLKMSLMTCTNARKVKGNGQSFSVANLKTFAMHGCKCVRCGRVGNKLVAWKDNGGGMHIDLFHEVKGGRGYAAGLHRGDLILMNRDHIIPKSKKGPNTDWNYQTMCVKCNCKKGNNETPQDVELAKFRARWRAIHVALHDGYWKWYPRFLRCRALTKATVSFRDRHLHKLTYAVARATSIFA